MARAAQARGLDARVVDMTLFVDELNDQDQAWISKHIGLEYRSGKIERSGLHQDAADSLYEVLSEADGNVLSTNTELIVVVSMIYVSSKPYFRRLLALGERARVRFLFCYQTVDLHVPFLPYMSGESPWSGLLGRPVTNLHLVGGDIIAPSLKETRIRILRGDMMLRIGTGEHEDFAPPTALSVLEGGGLITHLESCSPKKMFKGASDFFVDTPDIPVLCLGHDFRPSPCGAPLWSRLTGAPTPSGGVEGLLSAFASSRKQNGGLADGIIWVRTSAESASTLLSQLSRVREIVHGAGIRLVLSFFDEYLKRTEVTDLVNHTDSWLIDAGSHLPVRDKIFPGDFGIVKNATGRALALRGSDIESLLRAPEPATI
jgi:hypothetical protein